MDKLLKLVKLCDRQLSKIVLYSVAKKRPLFADRDAQERLKKLGTEIIRAGQEIAVYVGRGFLKRMLLAQRDKSLFGKLDKRIKESIAVCACLPACLTDWLAL